MSDTTFQNLPPNPWKIILQKLILQLKCPLCLRLYHEPVLLPCNHILCKSCISTSTLFGYECQICEAPYADQDLRPAPYIENMVLVYKSTGTTLRSSMSHPNSEFQVGKLRQSTSSCPPSICDSQNVDDNSSNRGSERVLEPVVASLPSNQNSSHEVETHCAFCHSSKISEESGPMLHFDNGKTVEGDDACQSSVIHVHEQCIEWAPQVFYHRETIKNLEKEVARGAKLKCSSCGIKGAVLGCYEKQCRKTYHVPCAVKVPDCRWNCENYLLLCPNHFANKFPNEKLAPTMHLFNKHPLPEPMTSEQSKFWKGSPEGMKKWVICGSALSAKEKLLLNDFANISGVDVSKFWKLEVTHVIAPIDANGACCRTLNVLMAILHGKWIVSIDWVKACMAAMHPVDEELYEVRSDTQGCHGGPKNGRMRILTKEPKLLTGFQIFLSDDFSVEYKQDFQNLVIAAGGTVLNSVEEAITQVHGDSTGRLVVYNMDTSRGCKLEEENTSILKRRKVAEELAEKLGSRVIGHAWLLKSIAACKLQPFDS